MVFAAERGRGRHSELKESQRALCDRWSTGTELQHPALTVSDAFRLGWEFTLTFQCLRNLLASRHEVISCM